MSINFSSRIRESAIATHRSCEVHDCISEKVLFFVLILSMEGIPLFADGNAMWVIQQYHSFNKTGYSQHIQRLASEV